MSGSLGWVGERWKGRAHTPSLPTSWRTAAVAPASAAALAPSILLARRVFMRAAFETRTKTQLLHVASEEPRCFLFGFLARQIRSRLTRARRQISCHLPAVMDQDKGGAGKPTGFEHHIPRRLRHSGG